MASTPEPHPRSTHEPGEPTRSSRSSRHSRVVACAPVPNAWPGSMTTSSGVPAGRSPRGRTGGGPAEDQGPVEAAPAVGPVVGDLRGADVDDRPAGGRAEIRQLRQLAGSAVDGVLDDLRADVDLLHP